jgi:hypothetical protein
LENTGEVVRGKESSILEAKYKFVVIPVYLQMTKIGKRTESVTCGAIWMTALKTTVRRLRKF